MTIMYLPLVVNAFEIEYARLNALNSHFSMRGEYLGGRVLGLGGDESNLKSEKWTCRASRDDEIKYEFQTDQVERGLLTYSKISFGPLTSYLPMQTNSVVQVNKRRIGVIKSTELIENGKLKFSSNFGGSIQELNINVLGEAPRSIEGYMVAAVAEAVVNYNYTDKLSLYYVYRREMGVPIGSMKSDNSEIKFGGKFYMNKIGFGLHLYSKRDSINFNQATKGVYLNNSSFGFGISSFMEYE